MSTSQQENNVCQPHIDHYYLFCQIVNILYFIEKVNQNTKMSVIIIKVFIENRNWKSVILVVATLQHLYQLADTSAGLLVH